MATAKAYILLILTDQQRTDTLGFWGQTPCRTPNMDRIAKEGISLDQAICARPFCLPFRAAIFTGQYPHEIDIMQNSDTLRVVPTLTDRLRARGYYTADAGKWHLESHGGSKAFRGRQRQLGVERFAGVPEAPKGSRVIDRWFDDAEGQSSSKYSDWCEDNGLPDGWPGADPDVRTHRTLSMTKAQDLPPDKTYDAWVTDILSRLRDRLRRWMLETDDPLLSAYDSQLAS